MRKLSIWRSVAIVSTIAAAFICAHAADVNGRIKGTVTDPAGAVVANAAITATNKDTGVVFKTTSAANGEYLFPELPVGTYTIAASGSGFKGYTATGIVLNIDQEYVEAIHFTVGSANEVVEVAASAVQVNTSDMELSNVVNSEQIVELPLISRNFTGLELTLPGVQASSDRFGTYSVSGGQTQQSEFLINGADTNDIALNTLALAPNLDAIDQFNLIDGPLNAEYDRNSGGIVSATIKQGTNKFHGDGFEFYRDTFLNTLGFFQKNVLTGAGTVSPYHQNIFGGTVGGPIFKNKLFFFGGYQGTRQNVPQVTGGQQTGVYNSALLAGDFSANNNPATKGTRPVYDPTIKQIDDWGTWKGANVIPSSVSIPGCATPGEVWSQCAYDLNGVFPTTSFNSLATSLTSKYVPAPNDGTYTYTFNPVTATTENQYLARVDYDFNPANQYTGLFIEDKRNVTDTDPFTGADLPGFGDKDILTIWQYTGDYVHQFNSSTVNDFAGHYTRFNYQAVIPQNIVSPSSLGFNINPQNAAADSVPTISVGGTNLGFELGFSTNGPQPRIDQVIQLDDSLSKVVGRHSLKFGYDGRRFNVSNPFSANNSGSYSFANTGEYSTGDGSLDFLLGIPATYSQGSGASIQADAFLNYVFAQDSWKITDNLTLSYGLGYSVDTPLHNNQYGGEGIACIVPGEQSTVFSGAPTSLVYPGDGGCYNSGRATTRKGELGPRFGFAWSPSYGAITGGPGKFSIRGGFGIYYDRSEEESALQTLETPPFGTTTSGAGFIGNASFADPFTDINGAGSVPNPFPYTFPKKGDNINFAPLEPIYDISTFGSDFRAPYAENFQISIEREFPAQIVARVSYVGSLGRHNQSTTDANPITPAGHAECVSDPNCQADAVLESVYYPQNTLLNSGGAILDIGQVDSTASSSYHSLQANVQKGMTHGLTFQLSYTYAHAMDTGSSFENAGFGESSARGYNQFYTPLNYGDSAYDVRQRLVFSPIYVTPMIHSAGSWYSPINLAVSGWEVSGIVTAATGFPYDVSYAGGSSNSLWCPFYTNFYACPDVPLQVAPIVTSNPRDRDPAHGSSPFVSKASFANEPIGVFGNVHRNPAHGPGINNTNMILAKNFYLSADRGVRLQIRMESDNVFNHTQFTNPGTTWNDSILQTSDSTFGYIGGTQAARQTQLAAKVYF